MKVQVAYHLSFYAAFELLAIGIIFISALSFSSFFLFQFDEFHDKISANIQNGETRREVAKNISGLENSDYLAPSITRYSRFAASYSNE